MDLKKATEQNYRNARSSRTDPSPYTDSRCYNREKSSIPMGNPSVKYGVHKYTAD